MCIAITLAARKAYLSRGRNIVADGHMNIATLATLASNTGIAAISSLAAGSAIKIHLRGIDIMRDIQVHHTTITPFAAIAGKSVTPIAACTGSNADCAL